jgi:UPF0755 protein
MKKLLLAVLVVSILCGSVWYWRGTLAVDSADQVRILVSIPQGSSLSSVSKLLSDRGLIRSVTAFSFYGRLHGLSSSIKAGSYVLQRSMNAVDIMKILSGGHGAEVIITIPEGFTVKDIDVLLAAKGLTKPGELINCAKTCDFSTFTFLPSFKGLADRGGKVEGYLFPDTYFVFQNEFVPKFFLERLLGTFQKRIVVDLKKDISESGHSLKDIMTMASLVEAETRNSQERPIVAGILWKRLSSHMSLGVDAALRYILDKQTASITESDLLTKSPYNLRKSAGLPPGPIGNPSLSSISASLHPQDSPYFYYLHDSEGQIHYAITNDEQNRNRARYLQ